MSSADSPRFDAAAAAQQMLDFEALPGSGRFPVQHPVPPRPAGDSGLLPGMLTDRGNAKLFADLYSGRFRHVEGLGWYTWDSYRWKRVGGEKAALWAAGDMAEQMPVTDPQGVFNDREIASHRRRTMSTPGMKALLHQAKAAPALSLDPDVLDGAAYELCTPKGVIDLHSGRLRLPDPGRDLHSRATTVPAEAAPTPRWDRFLSATFGDDAKGREMIDFLHLLLGYSITGDVGAQVLPFLWGTGANGKSVLMDVMIQILGDYADAAPPGFLMDKGAFGEHSTELTELHGRRIFVCSELKPNDKFDEARVKLLTGGDKIKARRMRQDYFSFTPTHKLWLLGNHRPEVGTGGMPSGGGYASFPSRRRSPLSPRSTTSQPNSSERRGPASCTGWSPARGVTLPPVIPSPARTRSGLRLPHTRRRRTTSAGSSPSAVPARLPMPLTCVWSRACSTPRIRLGAVPKWASGPVHRGPSPPASGRRWVSLRPPT